MTGTGWGVAGCLLVSAVAAAWPPRVGRRLRRRRIPVPMSWRAADLAGIRAKAESVAASRPHRLILGFSVAGAVAGLMVAGPVAALVGGVYGTLAARAAVRGVARRRAAAARARGLDGLSALSADLRAGLPPASAAGWVPTGAPSDAGHPADRRLADLADAVWRLAEQTGAPAADLVERIEADGRAADRARASAAAQAAGAQATALLLAALPLGGIALGYGIGADPLRVLLHTPIGAACAAGSVLLQCAGLLWADRLATGRIP